MAHVTEIQSMEDRAMILHHWFFSFMMESVNYSLLVRCGSLDRLIMWPFITTEDHNKYWLPTMMTLQNILCAAMTMNEFLVWDEIAYPVPNFNGWTIEVWEWISNSITHLIMDVITYPSYSALSFYIVCCWYPKFWLLQLIIMKI